MNVANREKREKKFRPHILRKKYDKIILILEHKLWTPKSKVGLVDDLKCISHLIVTFTMPLPLPVGVYEAILSGYVYFGQRKT